MKNKVHFEITKGDEYYCASAVELSIVTQAKTLDELMENIKEATELHLEAIFDESPKPDWSKSPSLLMNYEIPSQEHVKT